MRCFYSRGALFVVFSMALLICTAYSTIRLYDILTKGVQNIGVYSRFVMAPVIPFLIIAPFSGWLADAHLGNYRVFRIGALLIFVIAVIICVSVLILANFKGPVTVIVSGAVTPLLYALLWIGETACIITALQLGLDQMPEASSDNISSFISWFSFSFAIGVWISDSLYVLFVHCTEELFPWSIQIYSLFPVICMSILYLSLFLISPKWLVIEPNCPQSLRTIYKVLKFAAKHKAPLNRSALTYWEEDVPSRIDLGKARYGGPFCAEQVEDTKTVFKIISILIPIFVTLISFPSNQNLSIKWIDHFGECYAGSLLYTFAYSPYLSMMLTAIACEFCFYPLLRHKLPSLLKVIGLTLSVIILINSIQLALSVVDYLHPLLNIEFWSYVIYCVMFGTIIHLLFSKILEFVCAQSPYHMRGLISGYTLFLLLLATAAGLLLYSVFRAGIVCQGKYCTVVQYSVTTALGLVGLVLYCVLAHWYKMRVRDEQYDVYRVVEEVYDRYLSNEQRQ